MREDSPSQACFQSFFAPPLCWKVMVMVRSGSRKIRSQKPPLGKLPHPFWRSGTEQRAQKDFHFLASNPEGVQLDMANDLVKDMKSEMQSLFLLIPWCTRSIVAMLVSQWRCCHGKPEKEILHKDDVDWFNYGIF